jgi:MFS family permease
MPQEVGMAQTSNWKFAIRALESRNYRLFFGGQSISLIGTWMTRIATSWLVYRLTHSEFLLGLVGFAGQVPTFLLSPVAGVWVDRWDRHRLLVVTQVLSLLQSAALAFLALTGVITIWEVIALQLFQGMINSFDMPARQAFLVQMVDRRSDLTNAIALNSSMVNATRLLGPAVAGVIIAAVGEGLCFAIDAVSYLAVIASLLMMKIGRSESRNAGRVWDQLAEGWRYITDSVPIRSILLLMSLVSLVGMPYTVLMPVFASDILHGGPHTLGFLMAASGVGALASGISLAARRSVVGLGKMIPISAGLFGAGLVAFALSRNLVLSLVLLLCTGFGMIQQMSVSNTILQTIVDEQKRGRVMAFYSLSFQGIAPFGSLIAGVLAARIGAPNTLMIGGVLCCIGAAVFLSQLPRIRELVRPIYRQLGILPEVAAGMQSAAALQTPPEA